MNYSRDAKKEKIRVLGIDPGTNSFDFFGYETYKDADISDPPEYKPFAAFSLPSPKVLGDPIIVIDKIRELMPLDLIVAPSGFGLSVKEIGQISKDDLFRITLSRKVMAETGGLGPDDQHEPKGGVKGGGPGKSDNGGMQSDGWVGEDTPRGLHGLLMLFERYRLPAIVIPGIKQLATVPRWAVYNKIDLGTADKVCSVVLALRMLWVKKGISPEKANFILAELGRGFSAVVAVYKGHIINGIGGANMMGFKAYGPIDGEVGHLIGRIRKRYIYSHGLLRMIKLLRMERDRRMRGNNKADIVHINGYYGPADDINLAKSRAEGKGEGARKDDGSDYRHPLIDERGDDFAAIYSEVIDILEKKNSLGDISDETVAIPLKAYLHDIVKNIYALFPSYTFVRRFGESESARIYGDIGMSGSGKGVLALPSDFFVVLSGKIGSKSLIINELKTMLEDIASILVCDMQSHDIKQSAIGAAMIADGILGGPHRGIVERLGLKKSKRDILDDISYDISYDL